MYRFYNKLKQRGLHVDLIRKEKRANLFVLNESRPNGMRGGKGEREGEREGERDRERGYQNAEEDTSEGKKA